jgi:hypothetical protein
VAPAVLGAASAPVAAMPQVEWGANKFSRLIVGGNPVSANSHVSPGMDREMMDYFSAANVKKLLRNCEDNGINTWQSRGDKHIMRLLHEYRRDGGTIQWIGQTASELEDVPKNIREMAGRGANAVYHHGSRTDRAWNEGKMDMVRERLKVIRDTGILVGLGTHIPEVIDFAEEKGWDIDFYMACVYNLTRAPEEASKLAGKPIKDEFFYDPDRQKMLERVRRTRKPCLAFKVYGATRKCDSPQQMLDALKLTFSYLKPKDCIVVGMYPKVKEQVQENCRLVIEAIRTAPKV